MQYISSSGEYGDYHYFDFQTGHSYTFNHNLGRIPSVFTITHGHPASIAWSIGMGGIDKYNSNNFFGVNMFTYNDWGNKITTNSYSGPGILSYLRPDESNPNADLLFTCTDLTESSITMYVQRNTCSSNIFAAFAFL